MTRLILDSHPDFVVYEEDLAYPYLRRKKFERKKFTGFKIPVWTSKYTWLRKRYPLAKYIYLLRDPKSVISSMLTLKFGKKTWIERWGMLDLSRSIRRMKCKPLQKIFRAQFNQIKKEKNWLKMAALCAFVKQHFILEYYAAHINVLLIQYENLVDRPEKEIRKMLSYLGATWDNAVLRHHTFHNTSWGGTLGKRQIDKKSLAKWKKKLTPKDIRTIKTLYHDLSKHVRKQYGKKSQIFLTKMLNS